MNNWRKILSWQKRFTTFEELINSKELEPGMILKMKGWPAALVESIDYTNHRIELQFGGEARPINDFRFEELKDTPIQSFGAIGKSAWQNNNYEQIIDRFDKEVIAKVKERIPDAVDSRIIDLMNIAVGWPANEDEDVVKNVRIADAYYGYDNLISETVTTILESY